MVFERSGVIDMDEVDDAGEAAIALLAAGTPNLNLIEGLGIIALGSVNGHRQGRTEFFQALS